MALRWLRFARDWLRWFAEVPGYHLGDPRLDFHSKRMLRERHEAREPRWSEYRGR